MMDDPLLRNLIMVDEAHERSLSTNILLGLLKKIQRRWPNLRLVISSTRIEAKSMASYFSTSLHVLMSLHFIRKSQIQKIWTMDRVHKQPFYQLRDLMWRSSLLRILLRIIFSQLFQQY